MSTTETQAAIDEVRKRRDTAARLANGESTEDADHIRVLAGMIQKLAEQVERLAGDGRIESSARGTSQVEEAVVEEDRSPRDVPVDPANGDRST